MHLSDRLYAALTFHLVEDVLGLFLKGDQDVLFQIETHLFDICLLSHRVGIDQFEDEKQSIVANIEFGALFHFLNILDHQLMDSKSFTESRE